MSEMVERVVKAMERGVCATCGVPAVGNGGGYTDCDCAHSIWREATAEEKARAAIEAMREPTEGMLDELGDDGYNTQTIKRRYQAMIDEALK